MEELLKIAKAHYQASTDELQKLARDFFTAMDDDGDGKINLSEFLVFMREEGYEQMTSPSFFKYIDLDGNGTLDFWEVMMLYYIVKSGRPFCDHCKMFIPGTYFMCIGCLESGIGGTFYLCLDCHIDQKCDHTHNDLFLFLDNYSFLEAKIKSGINQKVQNQQARTSNANSGYQPTKEIVPSTSTAPVTNKSPPPPLYNYNNHTLNPSTAMVPVTNGYPSVPLYQQVHHYQWVQNNYHPLPPLQHAATSNAIVPQVQKWDEWKVALGALNMALQTAAISTNLCSIL